MAQDSSRQEEKGIPRSRQLTFFVGGALVLLGISMSGYGIGAVTPRLLTQYDAMQHYTLTSLMSSVGMLLFLPIVGRLVDTVGRKPLIAIGAVITLASSLAASFAPNFPLFLVLRALITVGIACVTPIPTSTLPFIMSREELPAFYGINAGITALGAAFGAITAGFFSDNGMTWLSISFPSMMIFVGCAIMLLTCPDLPKRPLPSIDVPAITLLFLIVGPMMYVASFGPRLGWLETSVLACAAVLIAAVILFIRREKSTESPLIDLKLFSSPVFSGTVIATFLLVWYQSAMRIYIPLEVQNVMGESATVSGAVTLPRSIISVIFPTLCGVWVSKDLKNRCWKGMAFAGIFVAVGFAILALKPESAPIALVYVGLGLTGLAESFKGASQNPAIQSDVAPQQLGSAMSLTSMAGSMGSAIGAAVLGVVHTSICSDYADLVSLKAADNAVFMTTALTGIAVVAIAFLLIRKMSKGADK